MNGEWELTASFGTFHLKIANDVLTLGGKDTCVMIIYKGPTDSILDQLGTNRSCELHGFPIKDETTKKMVYLATSIFRSVYKDVIFLTLLDASSYKCKFPDGMLRPITLREAHFLFHGKTYYEDNFGAVPVLPEDISTMQQFRDALHDSTKKPEHFQFKDTQLADELTPLYNTSSTWWEFFQQIQSKWKDEKCTKVYIWYRNALHEMMKGKTIPQYWKIDLRTFPFIHPKFKKLPMRSGGTRKNRKYYSYYDELDFTGLFPL